MAIGTTMALIIAGIAAAGTVGATASQARQAEKQQANIVRDATYAQGIESAKTQESIAKMEKDSAAAAKAAKEAPGIAAEEARQESIRRRAKSAKTLLTTPQGVLGEATTSKKTLLGG